MRITDDLWEMDGISFVSRTLKTITQFGTLLIDNVVEHLGVQLSPFDKNASIVGKSFFLMQTELELILAII